MSSVRDDVYAWLAERGEASQPEIRRGTRRGESSVRNAMKDGVRDGYYKSTGTSYYPRYAVIGALPDMPRTDRAGRHIEFSDDERDVMLQLLARPLTLDDVADHLDVPRADAAKVMANSLQRHKRLVVATYTLTERGKRVAESLATETSDAAE